MMMTTLVQIYLLHLLVSLGSFAPSSCTVVRYNRRENLSMRANSANAQQSSSSLTSRTSSQILSKFIPVSQPCPEGAGTLCGSVSNYPSETVYKLVSSDVSNTRKFNLSSLLVSDESEGPEEPDMEKAFKVHQRTEERQLSDQSDYRVVKKVSDLRKLSYATQRGPQRQPSDNHSGLPFKTRTLLRNVGPAHIVSSVSSGQPLRGSQVNYHRYLGTR